MSNAQLVAEIRSGLGPEVEDVIVDYLAGKH
jgi:hypothetical protein